MNIAKKNLQIELHPFDQLPRSYSFQIEIKILSQKLVLKYKLSGDLQELHLPTLSQKPERLDFLWKHTCFEAFFAPLQRSKYWELNFSPNGNWNCYHFLDYRKKHPDLTKILFEYEILETQKEYIASIQIDSSFFKNEPNWLIGINGVLETRNYLKSYWAPFHSKSKPDFHDSINFCIKTNFSTIEFLRGE